MKQQDFENRYQNVWQELEQQLEPVKKKGKGKNKPKPIQRKNQPDLYRQICHLLSLAKQRRYSRYLLDQLNQLAVTSHQNLYQYNRQHNFHILRFIILQFPQTLRKNATFVWIALALLFVPGFILWYLCYTTDDMIYSVMPVEQVRTMEAMYEPGTKALGRERGSDTDFVMFGHYIQNNIGLSFQTFASGILFGIGSIFFLVYNGLYIGAIFGHMTQIGYHDTFFPFVSGHGSFELTAIAFSGAAGLMLGNALIHPGQLSRVDALRETGKEAIIIMYGAALMLLIAAFIEAFWSSSSTVPNEVKYGVGAFLWLVVIVYCVFSGRGSQVGS